MDTDAILALFDHGEPLTTPQVADGLAISQRAAWVYLSALAEEGLIERDPGHDLELDTWSLSDAGREASQADEADP